MLVKDSLELMIGRVDVFGGLLKGVRIGQFTNDNQVVFYGDE